MPTNGRLEPCPRCDSHRAAPENRVYMFLSGMLFLIVGVAVLVTFLGWFGVIFGGLVTLAGLAVMATAPFLRHLKCRDCNHRWHPPARVQ